MKNNFFRVFFEDQRSRKRSDVLTLSAVKSEENQQVTYRRQMLALGHPRHEIDVIVWRFYESQLLLRVIREAITDVFVVDQFLAWQVARRQHENRHVLGIVSDVSKSPSIFY